MTDERTTIESQVIRIVADALDVDPGQIQPHSSLIDDLGAESIDFLDILFRVETAFDIRIQDNEMWRGSVEGDDAAAIRAAIGQLKQRMPAFNWDRFPAVPTKGDLPRLITIQTMVDYLQRRLEAPGASPAPGQ